MEVVFLDSRDLWYAKVLLPVFKHEHCKEVERIDGKRATWRINGERIIIAKKGKTRGQRKRYWQFTFNPNELSILC
ncbi:hypothetical protein [Nitrospira calida]